VGGDIDHRKGKNCRGGRERSLGRGGRIVYKRRCEARSLKAVSCQQRGGRNGKGDILLVDRDRKPCSHPNDAKKGPCQLSLTKISIKREEKGRGKSLGGRGGRKSRSGKSRQVLPGGECWHRKGLASELGTTRKKTSKRKEKKKRVVLRKEAISDVANKGGGSGRHLPWREETFWKGKFVFPMRGRVKHPSKKRGGYSAAPMAPHASSVREKEKEIGEGGGHSSYFR